MDGTAFSSRGADVLATNQLIHTQMLDVVRRHAAARGGSPSPPRL